MVFDSFCWLPLFLLSLSYQLSSNYFSLRYLYFPTLLIRHLFVIDFNFYTHEDLSLSLRLQTETERAKTLREVQFGFSKKLKFRFGLNFNFIRFGFGLSEICWFESSDRSVSKLFRLESESQVQPFMFGFPFIRFRVGLSILIRKYSGFMTETENRPELHVLS